MCSQLRNAKALRILSTGSANAQANLIPRFFSQPEE